MGAKKVKIQLFLFCLIGFLGLQARYVKQLLSSTTHELIDGKLFVHTIRSDNGKIDEQFEVDQVPVEKEEYLDSLEQAEINATRKQRTKKEEKVKTCMEFATASFAATLQKLVHQILHEAQQSLDRLDHEVLKNYYHFDQDHVRSIYHFDQIQRLVQQAQLRAYEMVQQRDISGLEQLLDQIELLPDQLDLFFKQSVDQAIKQSDDTTVLKELLSVVSV